MTSLTGQIIYQTYGDILTTTNSGQGLSDTLEPVQDGLGNSSPMEIALNAVNFLRSNGNTFQLDSIALTSSATYINSICQLNPIMPGTGGMTVPAGTTSQRDPSPKNGEIRYNTTINALEAYQNNTWGNLAAGTVLGPASSIAGDIVTFADTTGKTLQDSGVNITAVAPPLASLGHPSLLQDVQISGVDILNFGSSLSNDVGIIYRQTDYVLGIFPNTITNKFPNIVLGFANPSSTDSAFELTEGAIILSRITQTEINALVPIDGMIVYNTTTESFNFYQNGVWVDLATGAVLSVTGTTNQITTTGSSSVVVGLASNPIIPGNADILIPSGSTAQRPGTPSNGMFRYNTDNENFEGYQNGSWTTFGSGTGTVTSITAGSNLTGGTITTSGTIALSNTPSGLTSIGVGLLSLSTNQIISTTTNENIDILPNGAGSVLLGAAPVTITASGVIDANTVSVSIANSYLYNVLATGGTPGEINFYNSNNTNYVGFTASPSITSDVLWQLPNADGTSGQVLTTNGSGILSWGSGSISTATYILQTANAGLPNAQALDLLGVGLLKINASGVVQIAIPDTDYATLATIEIYVGLAETAATSAISAASDAAASEGSCLASAAAAATAATAAAVSAGIAGTYADAVTGAASAPFIIQQTNSYLPNAQSLGTLTTGIIKNTVTGTTGVLSTAIGGTDYYGPGLPTTIIDTTSTLANFFIGTGSGNGTLSGTDNVGLASHVLPGLTTGSYNLMIGYQAGNSVTTGSRNQGEGYQTLNALTSGSDNVGSGYKVLNSLISGNHNVAMGSNALISQSGSDSTSLGYNSGSTQSSYTQCTFLGSGADASASGLTNAIAIGYNSSVSASNSLILGNGNKVGIGTSSPSYPLHISNVNSVSALSLQNSSSTPSTNASGTVLYSSSGSLYLINGNGTTIDLSASGPATATYIVQTANAGLPNAQALSALSTGLLKNTTSTGVLTIGVAGTDYYSPGNPTTIVDTTGTNGNFSIGTSITFSGASSNTIVGSGITDTISGTHNCIFGYSSAPTMSTGYRNIGIGFESLLGLTTGNSNVVIGTMAGAGGNFDSCTYIGDGAGYANTGSNCTAVGSESYDSVSNSSNDVAIGSNSLTNYSGTGGNNTAVGENSGGSQASYTNCTFLGQGADASSSGLTNATAIGSGASVGASNSLVLGNGSVNVGIGTSTPNSYLDVAGGITYHRTPITLSTGGTYTALVTDYIIGVTSIGAGGGYVKLPTPSSANTGQVFIIKDEAGDASVSQPLHIEVNGGATIDGSTTQTSVTAYATFLVYSNGTSYNLW